MKKLQHREVKKLAQGDLAHKEQSSLTPESKLLTTI